MSSYLVLHVWCKFIHSRHLNYVIATERVENELVSLISREPTQVKRYTLDFDDQQRPVITTEI